MGKNISTESAREELLNSICARFQEDYASAMQELEEAQRFILARLVAMNAESIIKERLGYESNPFDGMQMTLACEEGKKKTYVPIAASEYRKENK